MSAITPCHSPNCWDKFPYSASLHNAFQSSMDDLPSHCIHMCFVCLPHTVSLPRFHMTVSLFCIHGYFLPCVLLTGSVREYKKSISYSAQEHQERWLLFSSFLPFFLSLVAAAILASHKDCYRKGQCTVKQMEIRVLWLTVDVNTRMWGLCQTLSSVLAPMQSVGGKTWAPYTAEAFHPPLQVYVNTF